MHNPARPCPLPCRYANGGAYRGPAPTDPVEQQRLALAQAQASSRRALGYPSGRSGHSEEREVAAAIEASLREQHSARGGAGASEDEQLRAAIQASLRWASFAFTNTLLKSMGGTRRRWGRARRRGQPVAAAPRLRQRCIQPGRLPAL